MPTHAVRQGRTAPMDGCQDASRSGGGQKTGSSASAIGVQALGGTALSSSMATHSAID
jgi:hypothetical protein